MWGEEWYEEVDMKVKKNLLKIRWNVEEIVNWIIKVKNRFWRNYKKGRRNELEGDRNIKI